MARITDVRATIWEWIGPMAPMPPNFCTTPNDLVADTTGTPFGGAPRRAWGAAR